MVSQQFSLRKTEQDRRLYKGLKCLVVFVWGLCYFVKNCLIVILMKKESQPIFEDAARIREREEQIKDGVWRPKNLSTFIEEVVCGASTKSFPGLVYLRNPHRFQEPLTEPQKIRATRSLISFLRALDFSLDPKKVAYPELSHSTNVVVLDQKKADRHVGSRIKIENADGLITQLKGYTLMILGADCPSIAVYDPQSCSIGVFHSGWRGTAEGIVLEGVKKMQESFGTSPANLYAIVGPGHSSNYEVQEDVLEAFRASQIFTEEELNEFFARKYKIHFSLDLYKALHLELKKAGICEDKIEITHLRTDLDNDLFPSYRREKDKADRFAFAIALK